MTERVSGLAMQAGVAVTAPALAMLADITLSGEMAFAMALYVIPVILSLWLAPLWAVVAVILTFAALPVAGVILADSMVGGMRGVMLLQILLIAGLVLAFRSSREEAERSHLRVHNVLEGSNTGFVATNGDLLILDANGPWLNMVGAGSHEEVVGTLLLDWLPPERRQHAQAVLGFLSPGDRRTFETTFTEASGQQRFVVITAYAEEVGDRTRLAAICADVTAIREAEAQARASEAQLRSHLENTPLAAVVLDTAHRVCEWNRAAEEIFAIPRDRALGMSAWELVPEAEQQRRTAPFSQAAAAEQPTESPRVSQVTGDGREVVIQWYQTPLRDAEGVVTRVASLGLDVTRQQEVERALRESEVKFSSVFHQSPDGLLLVRRRDRALLEVNDTIERMFGWPIREFRRRWPADAQFWARASDRDRFIELAAEHDRVEAFEAELLRRDGSHLAVLFSSIYLLVDGEPCHLLTIRDLTPIREGEEERYRLQEQLLQAQRMEGIGRLAGGVAHDFNNLLAGIQGYTELIELVHGEPDQVVQYTARIMETTQRASDLVSKLLTFSRQSALQKKPIDLHDVVADVVDLFRQTLDERIRVATRLDAPSGVLEGDETQISNALLNLCINARDALDGAGEIEVSTSSLTLSTAEASLLDPDLAPGDHLLLQVRDDGCGIDKAALENIFVPFYTTKPKGQGTGLGLPSVYGAVKAHGGTITVTSEPGEGACFSLYLPQAPASIEAQPAAEVLLEEAADGRGTILVVDDEPGIRDTMSRNLARLGYTVELASDGQEALERFSADPAAIDLVIMDVTMPRMSGDDAFRAMRKVRDDVDIILMSGFDRRAVLQRVLGEGAAGILKKPFTREELAREVARSRGIRGAVPAAED